MCCNCQHGLVKHFTMITERYRGTEWGKRHLIAPAKQMILSYKELQRCGNHRESVDCCPLTCLAFLFEYLSDCKHPWLYKKGTFLPVYLGDGRQGGQLVQWAGLPGQQRGPEAEAGQAAGGWAWQQKRQVEGSGGGRRDLNLKTNHNNKERENNRRDGKKEKINATPNSSTLYCNLILQASKCQKQNSQ